MEKIISKLNLKIISELTSILVVNYVILKYRITTFKINRSPQKDYKKGDLRHFSAQITARNNLADTI